MDFLRLFLLMSLLAFSIAAVERSRLIIDAQRTTTGVEALTPEDSVHIKHIGELARVQPVSIVVQDGMLLGTGRECVAETHDPTAHAETEAIRDACRRVKTSVLKNGVLYASRQPCNMCMSVMAYTGIDKVVVISTLPGSNARTLQVSHFDR